MYVDAQETSKTEIPYCCKTPETPNGYLTATYIIACLFDQEVEETEEAKVVEDLSNSDVTTKYQEASKIANLALQGVVQQCVAGARINDLCKFGDTVIEQVCMHAMLGVFRLGTVGYCSLLCVY